MRNVLEILCSLIAMTTFGALSLAQRHAINFMICAGFYERVGKLNETHSLRFIWSVVRIAMTQVVVHRGLHHDPHNRLFIHHCSLNSYLSFYSVPSNHLPISTVYTVVIINQPLTVNFHHTGGRGINEIIISCTQSNNYFNFYALDTAFSRRLLSEEETRCAHISTQFLFYCSRASCVLSAVHLRVYVWVHSLL